MLKTSIFGLLFLILTSTATIFATDSDDPYLWLEDIDADKSMTWVRAANAKTDQGLTKSASYNAIYRDVLKGLNNKNKLPEIDLIGDMVYSLKKDADHPRGLYQRTSIDSFKKGDPTWEVVLDIDAMSDNDNIKWVFHGMDCHAPKNQRCLVYLSPGGGDAHEMREFDTKSLRFVDRGFVLPTAKMQIAWLDGDTLFVATDFGENSKTESGYPRKMKLWQRGTSLSQAEPVFEISEKSVSMVAIRYKTAGANIDLLTDIPSYWTRSYYQLIDNKSQPLSLPKTALILDMVDGKFLVSLSENWQFRGQQYKSGSILLVSPKAVTSEKGEIIRLAESTPSAIIENARVVKDAVIITMLEDVKSKIYRFKKVDGVWKSQLVGLPENGQILIAAVSDATGEFFARYEGFITPPTLYAVAADSSEPTLVMQQPATFDSSKLKVEQYFAESIDGTHVPYFVVMNKDTQFNSKNPTHVFAYGGFRASLTPSYSGSYEDLNGAYGKAWLERGGVYVIANIRGGAEYGPAWHEAALLKNRYKAFEDFEAVAEDLFSRKITSPKHLGIEGRSNGGLLVGATMVRKPELYGAVICGVPLLDMKRYNKLLAGASWMGEYGNPDTDDWLFIKQYSPYQNVKEGQSYPPIFFFTSTRDDRVHPGHARKMAAKMKAAGYKVDYYENIEGGHKGSATSEQTAKRVALSFMHLWTHLQ